MVTRVATAERYGPGEEAKDFEPGDFILAHRHHFLAGLISPPSSASAIPSHPRAERTRSLLPTVKSGRDSASWTCSGRAFTCFSAGAGAAVPPRPLAHLTSARPPPAATER